MTMLDSNNGFHIAMSDNIIVVLKDYNITMNNKNHQTTKLYKYEQKCGYLKLSVQKFNIDK